MNLEFGNTDDREYLGPLRAKIWAGRLTEAQFCERNRRLYKHPFGRDYIQTCMLKSNSGDLLSSFDVLNIPLLIKKEKRVLEQRGYLIASVVTPEHHRGKGYAKKLLAGFLKRHKEPAAILFSDIEPKLYEAVGFREVTRWAVTEKVQSSAVKPTTLTLQEGLGRLRDYRRQMIKDGSEGTITVFPDAQLLDWHWERYRYFAELAGGKLPDPCAWTNGTDSFFAVPDYLSRSIHCLWMPPKGACIAALRAIATQLGMETIHFWWDRPIEGDTHPVRPMALAGWVDKPNYSDPQLIDWW